MKSLLENFAVFLVGLLSLALVYLIVQYNLIKDTTLDDVIEELPQPKLEKKKKTEKYLNILEGYEDPNVQVSDETEKNVNVVKVQGEIDEDKELNAIVNDSNKSSYVENLEEHKIEKDIVVKEKVEVKISEGDEIEDKVGRAIDDLLSDL